MNDEEIVCIPSALEAIRSDTQDLGFGMASEFKTGALLKVLAASKPGGRFLELGTGTGVGTAWLLAGMNATAKLDSVDSDERVLAVARRHLGADPRVTFHLADGAEFLGRLPSGQLDFIYVDTWPGKFTHLGAALSLLRLGGIYVVADLLPQPNWPEGHAPKVPVLIDELEPSGVCSRQACMGVRAHDSRSHHEQPATSVTELTGNMGHTQLPFHQRSSFINPSE